MGYLPFVALMLVFSANALAECAPEQMVRVVVRDATPGVPRDSFAARPKTYYRLGTKYGRVEEVADPEHGIHGLAVVSEPDLWMVNLMTKTGQHIVDTGAPYHFHAPVHTGEGDPEFVKSYELGCEFEYMKTKASGPPKPFELDGRTLEAYMAAEGEYLLVLVVDPNTKHPFASMLRKAGKVVCFLRYVAYETGLKPDLSLFAPPAGITFTEGKP